MAVGFKANLGLSSNLGYSETMSQKQNKQKHFFPLCPIFICQEVAADFRVDTEYIVQLFGNVTAVTWFCWPDLRGT